MRLRKVSISLAVAAAALLCACGGDRLSHPEEILERVNLEFTSVLGYVRVSAEKCGFFQQGAAALPLPGLLRFPMSLMEHVVPLCKEGGYINMVLLDAKVFGGPAALHFESTKPGGLAEALTIDEMFDRVPESDPPEFRWTQKAGIREKLGGMLGTLGYDVPGQKPFSARVIVEETPRGTLVMPSRDLRSDFLTFLKATDNLKPWGDTTLVVNLETLRLAFAYKQDIRSWFKSVKEILTRFDYALEDQRALRAAFNRMLLYGPEAFLKTVEAVEGIRFTSRGPKSGLPEFVVCPSEGGYLARLLSMLRQEAPDLLGLMPQGLAMQWNADPSRAAGCAVEGVTFYGEVAKIASSELEGSARNLIPSLAGDEGRYVWGLTGDEGSAALVFISAREAEAVPAPACAAAVLLGLIFTEEAVESLGRGVDGALERYRCSFGRGGESYPSALHLETGTSAGVRVTTLGYGSKYEPGGLAKKLLRLARMGAGKIGMAGLPPRAHLFLKLSLSSLISPFLPGAEALIPGEILAYGEVEEEKLVIRFLP